MGKSEKKHLAQKYQREFEVALIKVCMLSGGIGFAVGIVTLSALMLLIK